MNLQKQPKSQQDFTKIIIHYIKSLVLIYWFIYSLLMFYLHQIKERYLSAHAGAGGDIQELLKINKGMYV